MEEFNPEEYKVNGENYLLPLGSTRELGSHKGFGLAGMVDIFGRYSQWRRLWSKSWKT
ncbi:MAG: hypothetical protein CM1200mP33_7440 [Chloroflexota bacterium]|nr:MAG: hypothetical protein CM1200mP33_7440 [Chloroflexota bacterium]